MDRMKQKNQWKVMLFFFLLLSFSFIQGQVVYSDLLKVIPSQPAVSQKVTLKLYRHKLCCCTKFDKTVQIDQANQKINLIHQADTRTCSTCRCIVPPGAWVEYSLDSLKKGTYEVTLSESICDKTPCQRTILNPQKIGEIKVSETIYQLDKTGLICLVEPCRYFSATQQDSKVKRTISAVKTLKGDYACVACKKYVPWIDGDVPVKGYFEVDSLDKWLSPDTIFVVTEVISETDIKKGAEKKAALNLSRFISYQQVGSQFVFEIDKKLIGSELQLYDLKGNLQLKQKIIKTSLSIPLEKLSGRVYWAEVQVEQKMLRFKLWIKP